MFKLFTAIEIAIEIACGFEGNITKQGLFNFIQSRPTLAESLKINEGVIDLNTKKAQNAFLRLMDDSYLHSLLTDIDYMSNSKD